VEEYQSKYPFALALVRSRTNDRPSGFDDYFRASADWTEVKRTETATLYRRKR
jgi:hypothetical protein